ncbi:hypothetical protein MMC19_000601 [Ptychographa xylographoides]|nr:hypothetical protein [Ptychographa xylographoides]
MRPGSVWVYEIEEQKARVGIALQGVSSADEETKGVRKAVGTYRDHRALFDIGQLISEHVSPPGIAHARMVANVFGCLLMASPTASYSMATGQSL